MDEDRELEFAPGEPDQGNRVLIECALQAAAGSAVHGQTFTLRGNQLEAFFSAVRERSSRSPLSDTDLGPLLSERIDWWKDDPVIAIDFLAREDGSGIVTPIYEAAGEVPTSFPESVTRSPDAGWVPADLPADGTQLP